MSSTKPRSMSNSVHFSLRRNGLININGIEDICVCGHRAGEGHGEARLADDEYGNGCFYCACTRGALSASISYLPFLPRCLLEFIWAWDFTVARRFQHLFHDCGSTFGCRRCSTAEHSYSTIYRLSQLVRGRRSQFALDFYESDDDPKRGYYRMRKLNADCSQEERATRRIISGTRFDIFISDEAP